MCIWSAPSSLTNAKQKIIFLYFLARPEYTHRQKVAHVTTRPSLISREISHPKANILSWKSLEQATFPKESHVGTVKTLNFSAYSLQSSLLPNHGTTFRSTCILGWHIVRLISPFVKINKRFLLIKPFDYFLCC